MDFYLDENLPKSIAEALHVLEKHEGANRVYSTEVVFGKGIKDIDLIPKLKEANGVLITLDLKMRTRRNEFELIKNLGVTVFLLELPSGWNYKLAYQTIVAGWEGIKECCARKKMPFVCLMTKRGKPTFL